MQTIELDCAPGAVRPGDLLPGVLAGTGLEPRPASSMLFGNWTFDYSDVDSKVWEQVKPTIRARIEALYFNGAIRYGSW